MWDTTEEVFSRCGIQQRTISGWLTNFFPLYPTTQEFFCRLSYTTTESYVVYCIPLHRSFFCAVSHTGEYNFLCNKYNTEELWDATQKIFCIVSHNGRDFPPLLDTTEEVFFPFWDTTEVGFFCCGIQWKRFSSIVGYNRRDFFRCGTQQKSFFPLWDTMEKNDATQNDIFKF